MSSEAIGFGAVGVAVLCFGSNFIPIKKFETGDGVFFQWILCITIWIAGLIVQCTTYSEERIGGPGFAPFQPVAMLGGFLWCTGNMLTVPIIKCIGLSLGMLVWGLANLLAGWGSGMTGLFGLGKKQDVSHPALNYVGVALCCASLGLYLFVKSDVGKEKTATVSINTEDGHLLEGDTDSPRRIEIETVVIETSWVDRLTATQKRIAGIGLSVVAGIFYGTNFDPPQYIMDNSSAAHPTSQRGLDYVFSHFCGILLTSTIYMLIYCAAKKNQPSVYPQVILPAVASGALWAIADICWFVANTNLSFVVSFPMITTGPGVVASLWGIFAFREIVGFRNYLFLGGAFAVTITGVVLIALSRL
eukprot:TRINITY_DN2853_c0_g1_i1.p1 TRINITY_DN2853_c0_g1~~TRINITY_DN2853_c0_g1_i1.p1  ORF type:complete len:360 (+),score=72.67 TRINITY_DN2853_c0_g1_i1:268-1347(+)